jgi:hypothetical protein
MGLSNNSSCRRSGTGKKTSAHIICVCEALASLKHSHLGSFFLDIEDIKILSLGAISSFFKRKGLIWSSITLWGTNGLV